MRRILITTLGCKVNQFESETLSETLISKGFSSTKDPHTADIMVVNTCTVTQKASMQSRQSIRKLHRENPDAKIIVTGCYAQTEKEEILKIEGVTKVIPNSEKEKLSDQILALFNDDDQRNDRKDPPIFSHPPKGSSRTRPFLKIQDGCNTFCTYCIVPHARGRSRSMPFETAVEKFSEMVVNGYGEIVLTGIHLGAYGLDLTPEKNLYQILKALTEVKASHRIRLSSVEPLELTDPIISLVKASQEKSVSICRHFHIPLQSADEKILERMHRPYTPAYFYTLVRKIKTILPDAGVGADVLVGFPGESDDAFDRTYQTINTLPISYLHVFPFSPRKKTPAFHFPDKVPHNAIKKRAKALRALGEKKRLSFYNSLEGKEFSVIVEAKRDVKTGLFKGVTSNYVPVLFEGKAHWLNQKIRIKIQKVISPNCVHGIALDS